MNNCPKCGNPLQIGVKTCPICGTNIESNSSETKTVEPVNNAQVATNNTVKTEEQNKITSNEVVVTPVKEEAKEVVAVPTAQPVQTNQVSTTPVTTNNPNGGGSSVNQTTMSTEPVNKPLTTATNEQASPAQNTAPVVSSTPVVNNTSTVNNTASANNTPIANTPNVNQISPIPTVNGNTNNAMNQGVVPSIPSSLNNNQQNNTSIQNTIPEKKKFAIPKGAIIALVCILVLVVGGYLGFTLLNGNKDKNLNNNNNPNNNVSLATKSFTSHGYNFNLKDGYDVSEDGTNVIILNSEETVAIKLDNTKMSIDDIDKTMIEEYVNKYEDFRDTSVSETKISAKNTYILNTRVNSCPVQIYFIGLDNNLVLGITVVYQTEETKNKYEAEVTELVGSISYVDDSLKAINTLDMYRAIFNMYSSIIENEQKEPEQDVENNESNNNGENLESPNGDLNEASNEGETN